MIYTAPEIAWVGRSEQQLKDCRLAFKIGLFPFAASGRARAMEAGVGFVKSWRRATDRPSSACTIGRWPAS